jgi:acetyl esterase/lipase
MLRRFAVLSFVCFLPLFARAYAARADELPQVVHLWPNGAPGFEDRRDEPEEAKDYWVKNIHNPSITVHRPPPEKANGCAVLVVPGGGHRTVNVPPEGDEPANFLNNLGVTAFVLKYRLAREENSPYKLDVHPKQDAYRALRLIRSRADEWHIDPKRLGILGFSAGGEIVSMVAYEPGDGDPNAADPIDRANGRPDFQMVVYPGPLGIPDTVPKDAPPAFFVVANDDNGHVQPVVKLLNEYRAAGAPIEVHIFARGGHAFNMGNRSPLSTLQHWPDRMTDWLTDNNWLKPADAAAATSAAPAK